MNKPHLIVIITLFILSSFQNPVFAQNNGEGPIYIVQPGENLSNIAQKFGVDVNDLISINRIVNSNIISAGTQLIIPGLEGISGILSVTPIQLGETIPVILQKYQVSMEVLLKLNKITSPSEVYVGTNLILPVSNLEVPEPLNSLFTVDKDSSILMDSIKKGIQHWPVTISSQKSITSIQIPKEPLNLMTEFDDPGESNGSIFSPYIQNIELKPLPFSQGHTLVFKIFHSKPLKLIGNFDGQSLEFYQDTSSQMQYALDSVYALRDPGLAEFSLKGTFDSGESFVVDQMILIESGGFTNETLTVEST